MTSTSNAEAGDDRAAAMCVWVIVTAWLVGVAVPTIATVSALATSMSTAHSGTAKFDSTNPTTRRGMSSLTPYRISTVPPTMVRMPAVRIAST